MPENFDRKQVEISFRKFSDYASDVVSSNSNIFYTRLNIFIHHCESDPVMSFICNQLKNIDTNFEEWLRKGESTGGSMVGSCQFNLPVDEKARDALLYQLCLKINKNEIDLFGFCLDFFGSHGLDGMIYDFNEAIIKPMVRSIGYKLEEIEYDIETDLQGERYIPITVLNVYQDFSTTVNGNVNTEGDAAIGKGASIETKKLI